MRLCLTCHRISSGSALFCAQCGRTFGGRHCRSHHVSPADAQYCIQCGSDDLTDATRYLGLGWVSRLVAWGIVAVVAVVAWRLWAYSVALQIRGFVNLAIVLGFFLMFVPGNAAMAARKGIVKAAVYGIRWGWRALVSGLRLLWQLVEGGGRTR